MRSLTELLQKQSLAIWSRQDAKNVDLQSLERYHKPSLDLMERAAESIVTAYVARSKASDQVLVVAGPGNNGGDALAVARMLHKLGRDVTVYLVDAEPDRCSTDQLHQQQLLGQCGVHCQIYQPGCLKDLGSRQRVIVDGLLGLGFHGTLRDGLIKDCLLELRELQRRLVVAVDLPSGIDPDLVSASAILPADLSITFGKPKLIHVAFPAKAACGSTLCFDIGFAKAAIESIENRAPPFQQERYLRPGLCELLQLWQQLPVDAHKYQRGHVLIIGGGAHTPGAPYLSAMAALRAGAGWVTVATQPGQATTASVSLDPCLTTADIFSNRKLDASKLGDFVISRSVRALVIGPGMTSQALTPELISCLINLTKEQGCRIVLDAGALDGLGPLIQQQDQRFAADHILCTPHPGEWRKMRLIDKPENWPQMEVAKLRSIVCQDFGLSMIYKSASPFFLGPTTSCPWPRTWMRGANNSLARAGSGDVLAGIAGAFSCLNIPAVVVGMLAYELLSATAHRCATQKGKDSVIAHDLIETIGSQLSGRVACT